MSLYDDLDIDKGGQNTTNSAAGWGASSGFKLLQSQLQVKKSSNSGSKRRHTDRQTLAPVIDLKRPAVSDGDLRFNQITGRIEHTTVSSVAIGGSPFLASEPSFTGASDEYDPRRPNEYEDVIKAHRNKRMKEREVEKKKDLEDRERRRKERHKELGYDREQQSELGPRHEEEDDDYERQRRPGGGGGAAIAPPPSLIDDEPETDKVGESFGLGGSVAAKMMAKMGYKQGKGLGREGQGMSIALQVEKTSKRGGKIIHEKDLPKPEPVPQASTVDLLKNPSKVVLLRNMVGPGEVDQDLEPETAEECSKYGKVIKCMIFELPGSVEDEAVRIFVEFEKLEAAIKSVIDLNGRYFGGRLVKAGFYNLDKFRRFDLGDIA